MSIYELLNKFVERSGPAPNTSANKIRLSRRNGSLDRILADLYWCHNKTKHSKDLFSVERIMVESKWTDSILKETVE
jgi:hypothetical protein